MRRPLVAPALVAVIASSWLAARPASADETARQTAERTIDEVFAVLRATVGSTLEARRERLTRLRAVVDTVFDWEEMARRSLGVHWRQATPDQRARYMEVFKKLLANQYLDDMDKFRGTERVEVIRSIDTGRYTVVKSILTTHSRDRVPIDYTMRRVDGRWWIHDFSIEGVSLVVHYRNSFNRYLTNHSLESLLDRLEQAPSSR